MSKYAMTGIMAKDNSLAVNNVTLRVENVTSPIDVYFQNRGGTLALELPMVIVNSNTNVEMQTTYAVNTIANAVTLTLPSVVASGNEISFIDYNNTFGTNNLIIGRNNHKIEGLAENLIVNVSGFFFTLKYIDSNVGFKRVK